MSKKSESTIYLREPTATEPRREFYSANITHNLGKIAEAAGIYQHLWMPEKNGKAGHLIDPLAHGLRELLNNADKYRKLNPKWGDYEGLIEFVTEYRRACIANPEAVVEVSR